MTEQRAKQDCARIVCWLVDEVYPDEAMLRRHVLALETERNAQRRMISWRLTSRDACRKLERLYPVKETSSD